MRNVYPYGRSLAGIAARMTMPSGIREGVMVVAGLALVCMAPLCAARSPLAIPADEQSALRQAPAAAKAPPDQKPQGGQAQETTARAGPGAAATEQVEVKTPLAIYNDGELTIIAENASLSEVLAAVRAAMGADIDLPAGGAGQRIWVRLGPGPARQVLRDLLDGTEFNYVIQASESDSEGIRSVLLTVRSKSAEVISMGTQVARGTNGNARHLNASPEETSEPEVAVAAPMPVAAPAAGADAADKTAAEALTASPGVQSAASNLPATQVSPNPGGISGPLVGSSEEMMQQLQSMYEQRKQLQIQQNQTQKPQAVN
jgi:hypothetical protein